MVEEDSAISHIRPHQHLPATSELGFEPLQPLDLSQAKTVSDLLELMAQTPFGGREVGQAAATLTKMAKDPDTFVVMTIAGAMTPAKMGLIICDILDKGLVQAVICTGALMAHGLVEATGRQHVYIPSGSDDALLYRQGINRIWRAGEPERNLDEIEGIIQSVAAKINPKRTLSSRLITHEIGRFLDGHVEGRGILKSAYKMGIPVFIPAFTDSELGLDIGLLNQTRTREGLLPYRYDPFLDLDFYTELIRRQTGKKLGIFTIGGGVPRNWGQQVGPYLDLQVKRVIDEDDRVEEPVMFNYGVRICPEPVEWGGLSGCSYEEGKSWGKFWPNAELVEVLADATQVWPFIMKGVFERLGKRRLKKTVFADKKVIKKIEALVESRYYGVSPKSYRSMFANNS